MGRDVEEGGMVGCGEGTSQLAQNVRAFSNGSLS